MYLHPGFSFCVAPRFHSRLAWADRLRINGGVERHADRFYPRGDWRAVNAAELALLAGAPPASPSGAKVGGAIADDVLSSTQAGLVAIPTHIRAAWWSVAETADPSSGDMAGYEQFVAALIEFLRFKRVPLPGRCRFDVIASRPGQSSTRVDPTVGTLAGLAFSMLPPNGSALTSRAVAAINLGDEATYLVLLNLPPPAMVAMLTLQGHADIAAASPSELGERFFSVLSDYPLVQVRLDPGDGLWLPDGPVIYDGCTHGKQDLDIVLMIRDDGAE